MVKYADVLIVSEGNMSFDPDKSLQIFFKVLGHVKIPCTIRLPDDTTCYALPNPGSFHVQMWEKINN